MDLNYDILCTLQLRPSDTIHRSFLSIDPRSKWRLRFPFPTIYVFAILTGALSIVTLWRVLLRRVRCFPRRKEERTRNYVTQYPNVETDAVIRRCTKRVRLSILGLCDDKVLMSIDYQRCVFAARVVQCARNRFNVVEKCKLTTGNLTHYW